MIRPLPRAPVLAALCLGALLPAAASAGLLLPIRSEGPWLRADRELHFAVSLAMAASWRVEGRSRGTAFCLSFGLGIAKEGYDAALKPRRLGRGMSRKDLVADLLGAAAGVLLLSALDR
jgi:uncharacterized protein YfiM (DUF2279 family)